MPCEPSGSQGSARISDDGSVATTLTKTELEAAHCWEADDHVPRRPELTAFRRALRYHQAQWREANGHPIGSQPIAPRPGGPTRPVGSRLPLDYAKETGANFLDRTRTRRGEGANVVHRTSPELRSPAPVGRSPVVGGVLLQPVRRPGRRPRACRPRASHVVPGRPRHRARGPLRALAGTTRSGLPRQPRRVRRRVRARPRRRHRGDPRRRDRVPRREQTAAAEADPATAVPRDHRDVEQLRPEALDAVNGTELIHIWLDHLLVLSMLQHPSRAWRWGRLVVVHPGGNTDFADACERYRGLLVDDSTFDSGDRRTAPRRQCPPGEGDRRPTRAVPARLTAEGPDRPRLLRFLGLCRRLPELSHPAGFAVRENELVARIIRVRGVTDPPAPCLGAGRPPALLTAEAHDAAILRLPRRPGTDPNASLLPRHETPGASVSVRSLCAEAGGSAPDPAARAVQTPRLHRPRCHVGNAGATSRSGGQDAATGTFGATRPIAHTPAQAQTLCGRLRVWAVGEGHGPVSGLAGPPRWRIKRRSRINLTGERDL